MHGRRGLGVPNYMAAARKICQSDCPCEEAQLPVTTQQINTDSLEFALPFPPTAQPEATVPVVFVQQLTELNRILHDSAQLVVWRQPSPPKFTQVTCLDCECTHKISSPYCSRFSLLQILSKKALANPSIAAEDLPDFEGMVGHSNECFGVGIIF